MNLSKYYKENVKIIDNNGFIWYGLVDSYESEEEIEEEPFEKIIVDVTENNKSDEFNGNLIQFNEKEIKSIEII